MNKLSIVGIGQYLVEIQLFDVNMYSGVLK